MLNVRCSMFTFTNSTPVRTKADHRSVPTGPVTHLSHRLIEATLQRPAMKLKLAHRGKGCSVRITKSLKGVESRWKTLKVVESRWKTLKIVENRWKSLKGVENRWKSLKGVERRWKSRFAASLKGVERAASRHRWKTLKVVESRWIRRFAASLKNVESRWKSLKAVENRWKALKGSYAGHL